MPKRAGAKKQVANQALNGTSQEDKDSGATKGTAAPEMATKLGVEEGMVYSLEKLVEELGSVKGGWRPNPRSVGERLLDHMVDRCHRLVETIAANTIQYNTVETIKSQKEAKDKEVEEFIKSQKEARDKEAEELGNLPDYGFFPPKT